MNREDTFEMLCMYLEAHDEGGVQVEDTADLIMEALERLGEDILIHLEPPEGLKRWLSSHGLSLVPVRAVPAPAVWAALQEGEVEETSLEGESGGSLPLQVGEFIEYRTAPGGPRNQSQIGSGTIKSISRSATGMIDTVEVEFSPGGAGIMLFPAVDFIRSVTPPHIP